MPTLNYQTVTRGPMVLYSKPTIGQDSYGDYVSKWMTITRPSRVRRKKPATRDLFRSGTGYSVLVDEGGVDYPAKTFVKTGGGVQTSLYYISCPLISAGLSPETGALKSKIMSKIKGQRIDAPVLAAELGKTTDMFFDLCRSVVKGFSYLKQLRRKAVKALKRASSDIRRKAYWMHLYRKYTKKISNKWLEYAYGWKPLANDIWELSNALREPRPEGDRTVRASVASKKSIFLDYDATVKRVNVTESTESRAQARFTVDSWCISRAQQIGLTNPAASLWELVPFSFIIDYLVDVGEFLGSLDALVGISNAYWQTGTRVVTHSACSTYYGVNSQPGAAWRKRTQLNRGGVAPLTWSANLGLDCTVTAPRTANIVALLRQQMRF